MEDNRKRNMDRRRETSRFAARDRRAKESDIYDDLKEVVPVVEEPTVTHVDRIALLRVAATVCRYRKNVGDALTKAPASAALLRRTTQKEVQGASPWSEDSLMECLDGFILIADSDGVILYITESVSLFLGLTQTDFAGRHLRDFIAPDDYKDYLACTQALTGEKDLESARTCVLRIKTVISPRGRNLNLKSAILKPVAFNIRVLVSAAGHCHVLQAMTVPAGQGTVSSSANAAITKQGDAPSGTFMTRHTCDMRLSYVSEQLYGLLKSDSRSLMGSSYYELVHPGDAENLRSSVQELLAKGHTRTPYYRLLTGSGGVAWIMTEANTVSHTTRGQKGQYIIGIHHMLGQQSEEECDRGACEGVAAGMAVRIKQEPDDREYLVRQPEILDCLDFMPMEQTGGNFRSVPQSRTRRGGAFDDLSNCAASPFADGDDAAAADDDAAQGCKDDAGTGAVLHWLFREPPVGGEEGDEGEGAAAAAGVAGAAERRATWTAGQQPQQHAAYGVQTVAAAAARDPLLARAAYGRRGSAAAPAPPALIEDGVMLGGGRVCVGGGVRGGGGSLLQGASLQPQPQQQPGGGGRGRPVASPQNALSSSFSRACDLSSPPGSAPCSAPSSAAAAAAGRPRADSPITAASLERALRREALPGAGGVGGRLLAPPPQTHGFALPFGAAHTDAGAGAGAAGFGGPSQDVLASLPPAGFSAAQPLCYGVRRGQQRSVMASSLLSSSTTSGYGGNSCSPSSPSSSSSASSASATTTRTSTLRQQQAQLAAAAAAGAAAAAAAAPTAAAAAVCEVSLMQQQKQQQQQMYYSSDDSFDRLGCYAPYIDPSMDLPIGAGGLPNDLGSLLDLPPWNEEEGLPDFNEPKYERGGGGGAPDAKRAHATGGDLFGDDWPWMDNTAPFLDGRM